MAEPRRNLWARFLALPNESLTKTLGVAFLVALVSATTVSFTAIALKPRQQAQLDAAREEQLAGMIAALPGLANILRETGAESLQQVVVDLDSGAIDPDIAAADYDFIAAQSDAALSIALPPEADIAGIGRRPNLAPVYLMRNADGLALVVLPVYGQGYQSTIRAYLALEGDLDTIAGLSIYEQGDTPGLGARIAEPEWQALWAGKSLTDAGGAIAIKVVAGAEGPNEVDAITGATYSSGGVGNLVRFWVGPMGYGPFLARLKAGEF
ncbi:NADH:ubiquinone reductase (Na(+)-transporting) subunit C [Frigidibacter sp. ROC022]|uniref:NADH:ubiquinone reductase (Na(+)-transporting) subunit C n=1 Tax=Frigidibacter sp. ROC022 TaxID=2971796 RepID=UPI00215AB931|nr:NADH:ubiquinone reductase (Na(+)-transporting) subunit C [Frigidibacter sp. ROC022]MCR8725538.1 NADH:ubiquinone reductase (Na(+)-transporting) subunit C [Frigidibacter sp. ROC022]